LGHYCRAGSGSDEHSVSGQMTKRLEAQQQPDDWTDMSMERGRSQEAEGCVQIHGGKDWDEITALVPGRTKSQFRHRWNDVLKNSIDGTTGLTGG
jgi:hypothetical protein